MKTLMILSFFINILVIAGGFIICHCLIQLRNHVIHVFEISNAVHNDVYDLRMSLQNNSILEDDIIDLEGAEITQYPDDEKKFRIADAMIKKNATLFETSQKIQTISN